MALLFLAGGFYFRNKGLSLPLPHITPEEEGAVSGARTGVPKSFPEDIPFFEPAEIVSSLESQERIQVTLQTEASAERVRKFYQQGMEGSGWKLTGQGMTNDNGVLTFKKGERGAQVVITSDHAGPTLIVLNTIP